MTVPRPFAIHYDQIYADKDYRVDIDVVTRLTAPRSLVDCNVLELGAGTGNHTAGLVTAAKTVLSVEIDLDFADIFEAKMGRSWPGNLTFERRQIADIAAGNFDAAVALFHVFNYLGPDELQPFCDAVFARLNLGGCLIADIWNGAAALIDPPRNEIRTKVAGGGKVIQQIRPTLNAANRTLRLDYEIEIFDGVGVSVFSEQLHLFLWTSEEITLALRRAGFSNIIFWDYRDFPAVARQDSWRLWLKAEKSP